MKNLTIILLLISSVVYSQSSFTIDTAVVTNVGGVTQDAVVQFRPIIEFSESSFILDTAITTSIGLGVDSLIVEFRPLIKHGLDTTVNYEYRYYMDSTAAAVGFNDVKINGATYYKKVYSLTEYQALNYDSIYNDAKQGLVSLFGNNVIETGYVIDTTITYEYRYYVDSIALAQEYRPILVYRPDSSELYISYEKTYTTAEIEGLTFIGMFLDAKNGLKLVFGDNIINN